VQYDTERAKFAGHERDLQRTPGSTGDDLDYMHARYESPVVGRFLSVDLIDGESGHPVSWNRYTYARSNPVKLVDPTGLYVFECAKDVANCAAHAEAFEKARQWALNSGNAAVAAAAAAYGGRGVDNGVKVSYGDPGVLRDGNTGVAPNPLDGNTRMGLDAKVVIRPGLEPDNELAAVAHEGSHVQDAWGFVGSFTGLSSWVESKELTFEETETNAFRISDAVWKLRTKTVNYNCPGCDLGVRAKRPADVEQAIRRILSNPSGPYAAHLQERQFGGLGPPPTATPTGK
jgi:RHS repeat-associated protein